jgi:hypothetical protein
MDVVWMAKLFNIKILKNNKGQSAVEYILLLAVISSLGYAFYNNKKFKDLVKGKDGMFATMRNGMSYSYRYGLEFKSDTPFDEKRDYDYQTNKHDTYLNTGENKSRFFTGNSPYPK